MGPQGEGVIILIGKSGPSRPIPGFKTGEECPPSMWKLRRRSSSSKEP